MRLAILHPTDLLGQELREVLERKPPLGDEWILLTTDPEAVGTLVEMGGEVSFIQPFQENSLEGVDLAFFCGELAVIQPCLEDLPLRTPAVLLSPDAGPEAGVPVVAGVNLEAAGTGRILLSPHPGAVALAHLLHPLVSLGLEGAVATLLQPASVFGHAGLEELFEQTRQIVALTGEVPSEVLGHQLAFNVMPAASGGHGMENLIRAVLGTEVPVSAQLLQGSFFHGFAVSLYVQFSADPGVQKLRRRLAAHPWIQLSRRPESLGPIDAAARETLLVGATRPDPRRPGGYWIWAVMDNLTVGGALNARAIAEAVLAGSPAT